LELVSDQTVSTLTQRNIFTGNQIALQINIKDDLLLAGLSKPVAELRGNKMSIPVMTGLLPQQFTIYPDGSYTGLLKMQEYRGNSISLSSLSATLPVEYAETLPNNFYNLSDLRSNALERTVEANMIDQLLLYPQEKLHVHTDRDVYVSGERIWLKAYVADANSHQSPAYVEYVYPESDEADDVVVQQTPDNSSRYVYLELLSAADSLVHRVMLRPEEGMFHGYMPITESVPAGDYTLRAYTRYMENLGDDYFFKKNISIVSLTPAVAENSANRGNESSSANGRNTSGSGGNAGNSNSVNAQNSVPDFDVTFFPEGGNLPEGVFHRVAFKALSQTGHPESVSGRIIDGEGTEITPVQTHHAGMGVFYFQPEAGKRYYLECTNGSGLQKRFALPQSDSRAQSLSVSMMDGRLRIGAHKSVDASDDSGYLLVHSRGMTVYFSQWDAGRIVSLGEEELPAGVIQVVWFGPDEPVERTAGLQQKR
jgi:hypothetical protein